MNERLQHLVQRCPLSPVRPKLARLAHPKPVAVPGHDKGKVGLGSPDGGGGLGPVGCGMPVLPVRTGAGGDQVTAAGGGSGGNARAKPKRPLRQPGDYELGESVQSIDKARAAIEAHGGVKQDTTPRAARNLCETNWRAKAPENGVPP